MGNIDYKPDPKDIDKFWENMVQYLKDHPEVRDNYLPEPKHEEKFLGKLGRVIKKTVISIVPHVIKASIITIVVWIITFLIWRIFLYPVSIITILKSIIG